MIKICHLRGHKEYWKSNNNFLHTRFKVLKEWENIRNFSFFEYRKKIRDITINSVIDSNEYDIICYNDEEFLNTLNKLNNNEVIAVHSQDDDDIYLRGILNNNLKEGIYNAFYVKVKQCNMLKLLRSNNFEQITLKPHEIGNVGFCRLKRLIHCSNLIIISKFSLVKDLLLSVGKKSFNSRRTWQTFVGKCERDELPLSVNNIDDIIILKDKGFFGFTFFKNNVPHSLSLEQIDAKMCRLFLEQYLCFKNTNISNVSYWAEFQNIYEQFLNDLQIDCNLRLRDL
tara:strand:+ start:553 stop:1404 length:852 start_codon:yes stop_codon:yes gene_type:complete